MGRFGRGTLALLTLVPVVVALVVAGTLSKADDRTKGVEVPAVWAAAWSGAHTREGDDVVLVWGDLAGADPRAADPAVRFDPVRTVANLDALYDTDVRGLQVAQDSGPVGRHKVLVVADGTWSDPTLVPAAEPPVTVGGLSRAERTASGSVEQGIGVVRAQVDALRGTSTASWSLARGFAEMVQDFAAIGAQGVVAAPDDPFRSVSSAYVATASAGAGIGDPSDLVRAPSLPWAGARTGDGGWLLLHYLAGRDGEDMLGRVWREGRDGESPVEAYRRLAGLDQSGLNRRVAEYALRTVAWDFQDRDRIEAAVDELDPVLLAHRSTPVEPVADDPGRFQVLGAYAPSDYGFNLVHLTPDAPLSTIRVRLRGHLAAPGAGWSVGVVALRNGAPRYSPVVEGPDDELQFTLRKGETDAYLVVVGTPTVAHGLPDGAGYGQVARYPYEFRVDGARVTDTSQAADPGAGDPVAAGHRHPNGGGWVGAHASVDATAFVGPHAVVVGDARVLGTARVEGTAWVDGGVVEDRATVRDMAVVRSGARLGGDVVVGGDAVVDFECAAGTYASYAPDRTCDGLDGPPDVNLPVQPFTAEDLAFGTPPVDPTAPPLGPDGTATGPSVAGASSAPTGTPTGTPSRGPGTSSSTGPTTTAPGGSAPGSSASGGGSSSSGKPGPGGSGSPRPGTTSPPPSSTSPPPSPTQPPSSGPTSGVVPPPEPVAAGACLATYNVTNAWTEQGRTTFQAQVVVTLGTGPVSGWAVSWQIPSGLQILDPYNAQFGTSGSTVTAENMSYNGTLREGSNVLFGFRSTAPDEATARRVPQVTCTRTR